MKIFIDTGDIESIKLWMASGIGSGVTTNEILSRVVF